MLKVPEGRNNVAHPGRGGRSKGKKQKAPSGATRVSKPNENGPSEREILFAAFGKNQQRKCIGQGRRLFSPRRGIIRRRRKNVAGIIRVRELRGDGINIVILRVERHGARALHGLNRLHDRVFVRAYLRAPH